MHRPFRGAFQRSLTLLVRYRSRGVFSLLRGCLSCSQRISDPCYSGIDAFCTGPSYGVVTLCHAPFQETSDELSRIGCQPEHHIGPKTFGLGCVAFTRGYSRHRGCVLFLPLLRCFNSGSSLLRVAIVNGFRFGNLVFCPSMRVPRAFRSLARPSSALEPSHSPAGTVASSVSVDSIRNR